MKLRSINKNLLDVYENVGNSLNGEAKDMFMGDAIIAGGCIASLMSGKDVNDYDFYFADVVTAKILVDYYVNKIGLDKVVVQQFGDQGAELLIDDKAMGFWKENNISESGEYDPIMLTANAITLKNKVQLIIRYCGDAKEVVNKFDFDHCTNYWTKENGLVLNEKALSSILTGELRYMGSDYPLASLFRCKKFIERGWNINAGQLFKIAYEISKLDLNDRDVLQEQLIGVDMVLFAEFVERIRQGGSEKAFLFDVINELFG